MRGGRRRRPQLLKANCKRCGTELYTLDCSIFGQDGLKKRIGVLCHTCITPAEEDELLRMQAAGALRKARGF